MKTSTELRAVIDAFAARHAAAGANKRPLLDTFRRMQRAAAAEDSVAMAVADRDLHVAIVVLAGVDGLIETWQAAAAPMERFRVDSLVRCRPDLNVLFEAHRSIVDAILAGDAVSAEDAARGHLDAVWCRLAETSGDATIADDPLARAVTYLDFHMQEPVQLAFLAEHVARTRAGHLGRLFRLKYRVNFTEYVRALRMHKAVGLLTTTSQPIAHIARIVGYADASRFGVHVRRRYGLTPRAHRQRFGHASRADGKG